MPQTTSAGRHSTTPASPVSLTWSRCWWGVEPTSTRRRWTGARRSWEPYRRLSPRLSSIWSIKAVMWRWRIGKVSSRLFIVICVIFLGLISWPDRPYTKICYPMVKSPVLQKIYASQDCISNEHHLTRTHLADITGYTQNIKRILTNNIRFLYARSIRPSVTGSFTQYRFYYVCSFTLIFSRLHWWWVHMCKWWPMYTCWTEVWRSDTVWRRKWWGYELSYPDTNN